MAKRIAFYGGSFNPPHVGHVMTITYVLATQNVNEILVAPVYKHPDGKKLAPYDDRVNMVFAMTEMFDSRKVRVSLAEKRVYEDCGSGLTINTVRHLLTAVPTDTQVLLILGFDILPNFESWSGYHELAELRAAGRIDFFFVGRTGHGHSPVEMPRISSSEIRQMLLSSGEMNEGMLAGMLPAGVRNYIKEKNLYRL